MKNELSKLINEFNEQGLTHLENLLSGVKYKNFTGWLNPVIDESELERIKLVADKVRKNSDVFVVIGVGGSYLGARAVIEALTNKYNKDIEIMYLGNSLSSLDLKESLDYLKTKDFTVNVISKSGTTLEPALAFSLIKDVLYEKYSKEEALERIIVTTDKSKGSLRKFADENNVGSFTIPDDVGGRYSVLTPVGLLPIAVAGIDVDRLISGAREGVEHYTKLSLDNFAINYASMRNAFHSKGIDIELLVTYEPRLHYFQEWWKQLFGESEGKDGKGLFPATATFTTDLHSLGQLIQDGKRNLFSTHISFEDSESVIINPAKEDEDVLGHLKAKTVGYVNEQARLGTIEAHSSGGVPILEIKMTELNEESIGQLIYLFMLSCAISSMILGVHPFNQPGVEKYKENMRQLLEK